MNEIEQVEVSIEQAKEAIAMRDTMRKLIDNRAFKKIVTEGYFKEEASRLVLLRADPSMQGATERAAIDEQIAAIGQVRQYFSTIMQLGNMADKALVSHEETRDELLSEDL